MKTDETYRKSEVLFYIDIAREWTYTGVKVDIMGMGKEKWPGRIILAAVAPSECRGNASAISSLDVAGSHIWQKGQKRRKGKDRSRIYCTLTERRDAATLEGYSHRSRELWRRHTERGSTKRLRDRDGAWRKCWPERWLAAKRRRDVYRVKISQWSVHPERSALPAFTRCSAKGTRGSKRIISRCRMVETRTTRSQ